jgi:hypothetical protein
MTSDLINEIHDFFLADRLFRALAFNQYVGTQRSKKRMLKLAGSIFGETICSVSLLDWAGRLMEDTVDLLSLAYEVERQQGARAEVRRETGDFYRNVAAIFVTICSVAAKLNSDSEKTFSLIVEDLLRATESRNKTIDHLRDLTLRSTTSKGRDLEKITKQTPQMLNSQHYRERKN